ncbi:MAG: hypothetical protein Q8T13_23640 [Acidobacteriota bacterium]|nr:hypothetical protein [Acidobacteriota bacterium]
MDVSCANLGVNREANAETPALRFNLFELSGLISQPFAGGADGGLALRHLRTHSPVLIDQGTRCR